MTGQKAAILYLVISIVFAIAILFYSWLLRGTGYQSTVMFLLIAVWWVPFYILCVDQKPCCKSKGRGGAV